MIKIKISTLLTGIIALSFLTNCSSLNKETYQLGNVNLEVDGSKEAIKVFDKGLLLLHSFEYFDAAEAFVEAQEIDSTMAMAFWGEAMTHNHPLWRQQDYEKGNAALKKLAPTKGARSTYAKSPLERDLLRSVEILYGEGTKFERDKAYCTYLSELHSKYPNNHEVSAFYAVSLLGSVEEGRDDKIYEKSAVVANGILKENPNHPGALHYLIHSYDDPKNAYKALAAANSYSQVAKDASHALHMPSHIYVALGMWNAVVSSNEASFTASAERAERKDLKSGGSYHALHWLMYGYLQQGRFEEAEELLKDMVGYNEKFPSKGARDYLIAMKGTFLVETNDWDNILAEAEVDYSDLLVSSRSAHAFIKGMQAYVKQDTGELKQIVQTIDVDRTKAYGRIETRKVAMCSGNWQYEFPNELDINQSYVMQLELSALLAWSNNQSSEAIDYMEKAAKLEETISYSYGPPAIPKPSHELYGELLLKINEPAKALVQFNKALQRAPKRILSLRGKLAAYQSLNQPDSIQFIQNQLDLISEMKDEPLLSSNL